MTKQGWREPRLPPDVFFKGLGLLRLAEESGEAERKYKGPDGFKQFYRDLGRAFPLFSVQEEFGGAPLKGGTVEDVFHWSEG